MRGYNGVVVPAKTLRMMTDLVKKYLFVLLFFGITVNGHALMLLMLLVLLLIVGMENHQEVLLR